MGDFLGLYYANNGDDDKCDSRRMAIMRAEQPVSIVEMDTLEKESGRDAAARRRMMEMDAFSIPHNFNKDDGMYNDQLDGNASSAYNDEYKGPSCDTSTSTDGFRPRARHVANSAEDVEAAEDDDDDLEIPVASITLLENGAQSMKTVPLTGLLNTSQLQAQLQSETDESGARSTLKPHKESDSNGTARSSDVHVQSSTPFSDFADDDGVAKPEGNLSGLRRSLGKLLRWNRPPPAP